jgi:hypothetical protein
MKSKKPENNRFDGIKRFLFTEGASTSVKLKEVTHIQAILEDFWLKRTFAATIDYFILFLQQESSGQQHILLNSW